VNARSQRGSTPLNTAAANDNAAAVHMLLEHGADSTLNTVDGHTALSTACEAGHRVVVELLLRRGADMRATVKAVGYFGVTVLMQAALYGHLDVAKVLLAWGADVHAVDEGRRSPLCFAGGAKQS
jgi:ankyrin repeat protein